MKLYNRVSKYIFIFISYLALSCLIFWHRITNILTHYGLDNVDTDGTFWYLWFKAYSNSNLENSFFTSMYAFPFGVNLYKIPYESIFYDFQILILQLLGGDPRFIILVTNISMLITYPLSGFFAFILAKKISKDFWLSFIAGIIYSFSFYSILMGRGSLSLNQIWIIPLYYTTIIWVFEDRTNFIKKVLISTLLFVLIAKINLYWAFFTQIFSIIFIIISIYKKHKTIPNKITEIKKIAFYYITLFIITTLASIDLIVKNMYVFNTYELHNRGKIIDPSAELSAIRDLVTPGMTNYLFGNHSIISSDLFIGFIQIFLVIISIYILKINKNKILGLLFTGLSLSVTLYTHNSIFPYINDIYFKVFGMFRGVSRLTVFTNLFLGLIISYSISESAKWRSLNNKLKIILTITLVFAIIINNLNSDPTWKTKTNLSIEESAYSPISQIKNIETLMIYPIAHNIGGSPKNRELLAQIYHKKQIVNGFESTNPKSIEFYEDLKSPKRDIIKLLQDNNIDAILVYQNDPDMPMEIYHQILKLENIYNYNHNKDAKLSFSLYLIPKLQKFKDLETQSLTLDQYKSTPYKYEIPASLIKGNITIKSPNQSNYNIYALNQSTSSSYINNLIQDVVILIDRQKANMKDAKITKQANYQIITIDQNQQNIDLSNNKIIIIDETSARAYLYQQFTFIFISLFTISIMINSLFISKPKR